MKRILSIALLATTFAATAGAAQTVSDEGKARKEKSPAAEAGQAAGAAQKKDRTDCSPQRAGVRCNRPKPKKPWFFGK